MLLWNLGLNQIHHLLLHPKCPYHPIHTSCIFPSFYPIIRMVCSHRWGITLPCLVFPTGFLLEKNFSFLFFFFLSFFSFFSLLLPLAVCLLCVRLLDSFSLKTCLVFLSLLVTASLHSFLAAQIHSPPLNIGRA